MFDFKQRIRRLRAALKKEKLDALVVATVEGNNKNIYYLCGFGGTTGALVVSKKGAILAVDARYTLRARREAKGVQVVPIPKNVRRSADFAHYIGTALDESGLSKRARVGFEGARVSVLMSRAWNLYLKRKLIPTRGVVERLRQVKDAEEIRHMTRAGKLTSAAFVAVSKKIRAGLSERDIANLLEAELKKRGALSVSFETIVASGVNSASPHHETGTRKVKAGEPVVLDFGGVFTGGYCSDLTRTIFVRGTKPEAKLIEMYNIVLEANKKAFKALKPGLNWKEYDAAARRYISEKGYGKYFTHGLGHSIGLEVHDPFDHEHGTFAAGMVFSDEPGIYIENVGGVRIEDDVVVTSRGAKRLTPAPYLKV